MFGICDGHGQYGREVSSYVKVALTAQIQKNYGHFYKQDQVDRFKKDHPEHINDPHKQLRMCMKDCFLKVNLDIQDNVPNCQFSGTTCSVLLVRGP